MNLRLFAFLLVFASTQAQQLRPPAYPLITHDPYLSIWSSSDKLYQSPTQHWTGKPQELTGLIRVDGRTYQFMGRASAQYQTVVPTEPVEVRYTTQNPENGWQNTDFQDNTWAKGHTMLGSKGVQNALTPWNEREVWYRREFNLDKLDYEKLMLSVIHDDDVEVYLNGVLAYRCGPCFVSDYMPYPIAPEALKALKKGKNLMAIHCTNTGGPGYVNAGLVNETSDKTPTLTAEQKSVKVTATQTTYTFACGNVMLNVNFCSPLLLDELDVAARPASYVTFTARSTDNKPHETQVLFCASGNLAVNKANQVITWKRSQTTSLDVLSVGTKDQKILETTGDDRRIDWGYALLAVPNMLGNGAIGREDFLKQTFRQSGRIVADDDQPQARPANDRPLSMAASFDFGRLVGTKQVHLILAYDDLYSVQYFGKNLRAWWRKDPSATAETMLEATEKDYYRVLVKCDKFDTQLWSDAQRVGGKDYADLCQLAYRQAIAAHKMVSNNGELLFFSKENFSNGSIGTVDVTYPSAPMFLYYSPELMKGMLEFILYYSESGKWSKPFAAHDMGTYPQANGQTYPADMPVEECGNMLILAGAVSMVENKTDFAKKHWSVLSTWAEYLKKEGFDPANQLCTDDFAGHLARNANLSVKAILGLAAYARMAEMMDEGEIAAEYTATALSMARRWKTLAQNGNHYGLTFEGKDSWSQKYNLVWDKVLDLRIFPKDVAEKEVKFYLSQQQPYGLPLDSRKTYTKADWIIWTATLANTPADFQAIVKPVWKYAHETPSRVPMADWYETTNAKQVGFQARSVVGGYFIKLLEEKLKK